MALFVLWVCVWRDPETEKEREREIDFIPNPRLYNFSLKI